MEAYFGYSFKLKAYLGNYQRNVIQKQINTSPNILWIHA